MPTTRYKVWAVGPPVGDGVTDSFYVQVQGIAKADLPGLPHVVANELICARLAAVLLLPVPSGFIIDHDGRAHYVSLNFNLSGHDLPPANTAALMAAAPRVGAGIIAFDAWIVNPDRHRWNIAFDTSTHGVQIFDHSHAFYSDAGANLSDHEDDLGFERSHCLANDLTSFDDLAWWCELIRIIPRHYIQAVINEAVDVGLPAGRVDYCVDFLVRRRDKLLDLFRRDRALFPNVIPTLWDNVSARVRTRRVQPKARGKLALGQLMARLAEIRAREGGKL